MKFPVQDEAETDTRSDGEEAEVLNSLRGADITFGQRGEIDVVLDDHVLAERASQFSEYLGTLPSGQSARHEECVAPRVIDAGTADDRLRHGRPFYLHHRQQFVSQDHQLRDAPGAARRMHVALSAAANFAREIGDGTTNVFASDVEAEHEAGLGPKLVQRGRPAPTARGSSRGAN